MSNRVYISYLLVIPIFLACFTNSSPEFEEESNRAIARVEAAPLKVGAASISDYLPLIQGKKIALVVNQTSRIEQQHLVDSLLSLGINIRTIFAPEHGFRGTADAGEQITDGKDSRTGIPLISLYGKNKKPTSKHLKDIDWVLFDIQDVGVRFYTYISTMHYVMQACAEENIPFMVLDRPNPNRHYVDGPVLQEAFKSFVGVHPVPIVHGMTVGEYAKMVNEEGWLGHNLKCELHIIPCRNYSQNTIYELPIKPSPNLPNNRSIYLYPSLCLFEGTDVSVGRGTNTQFQVYGHPDYTAGNYAFTPISMEGAKYPKHQDKECNGYDLQTIPISELGTTHGFQLRYLLDFYNNYEPKASFFLKNHFFDKLAGTDQLRKQIIAGASEADIRASWKTDLEAFKKKRAKYLIYGAFKK